MKKCLSEMHQFELADPVCPIFLYLTGIDVAKKNPYTDNDESDRDHPIFVIEDTTSSDGLKDFVSSRLDLECESTFKEESWKSLKDYLTKSSTSTMVRFIYTFLNSLSFTSFILTTTLADFDILKFC